MYFEPPRLRLYGNKAEAWLQTLLGRYPYLPMVECLSKDSADRDIRPTNFLVIAMHFASEVSKYAKLTEGQPPNKPLSS